MVAVLIAVAAVSVAAGRSDPASAAPWNSGKTCVSRPTPLPSDTSLHVVSDRAHGRLHTFTIESPAVGLTHVNVLVPEHYSRSSSTRYPVLYLLHGALSSYADWVSTKTGGGIPLGGNAQAIVGHLPIIVVMPDDSPIGSYSDWYGISTKDAAMSPVPATPSWETYHIDELIPWVDSTFHTKADPAGRAIAGLSSGGGGAAKYVTGHPGVFGFMGTFSGAVDNDLVDGTDNWYNSSNSLDALGPPDQHCTFGDPSTDNPFNQLYYWYQNDPTYEARNLQGVKLFVASGNGTPTSADAPINPAIRAYEGGVETVVDDMSHHFVAAVQAAGLGANVTTDFYGDGSHAWVYWQRDLVAYLRWLQPQLHRTVSRPSDFSFRTARATSAAWGWSFHYLSGLSVPNVNTAEQFVYLSHISANGLTASGNGTLQVTTPRGSYPSASLQTLTVGQVTMVARANRAGELTFSVAIGPPATSQQVDFPASGPPPTMHTVVVSIHRGTGR